MRTYTRGQLAMMAHGSRVLFGKEGDEEETDEDRWLRTADTRKMTLDQYREFIRLQQERLNRGRS